MKDREWIGQEITLSSFTMNMLANASDPLPTEKEVDEWSREW
jgi:hypothetical protein